MPSIPDIAGVQNLGRRWSGMRLTKHGEFEETPEEDLTSTANKLCQLLGTTGTGPAQQQQTENNSTLLFLFPELKAMFRTTGDGQSTRATEGAEGIRTHHGATQQGDHPCRTYRPPHQVFTPRGCCQTCKVAYQQAVIAAACALLNNSSHRSEESQASKTAQSLRTRKRQTAAVKGKSRRKMRRYLPLGQ
ncbi:hypothetical protein CLF_108518 [Clonorchis sinensis]|uniref:Uncharacterized protein n=1 Tax=Clonorchis sinensis TaxID=79923 RepID=G7YI71_CLOSI|nr:hypothetical protein CLF_108518 [Clonorchis sinensis]